MIVDESLEEKECAILKQICHTRMAQLIARTGDQVSISLFLSEIISRYQTSRKSN